MITLQTTPAPLSFIRNSDPFVFAASDVQTAGTISRFRFTVSDSLPGGQYIDIAFCGRSLRFFKDSMATASDAYHFSSMADLCSKLQQNFYTSSVFSFSIQNSYITVQGIQAGLTGFQVSTDYTGSSGSLATNYITIETLSAGSDPVLLSNYSVLCRIDLADGSSTPWSFHTPAGGSFSYSPDLVTALFSAVNPSGSFASSRSAVSSVVKYRISYAECYGSVPVVQQVQHSSWLYAINGITHSTQNYPDWTDARPTAPLLSSDPRPFVIGEDHNIHADIRRNQDAFLYLGLFASSQNDSYLQPITLDIVLMGDDIEPLSSTSVSISLPNNGIFCLPVSPSVLSIPDSCHAFGIRLYDANGDIFTRTYSILPALGINHRFLARGRHGVLTPFSMETVSTSCQVSADFVRTSRRDRYIPTDSRVTYTATSPAISRHAAEQLMDAFSSNEVYYFHPKLSSWLPISFAPATVNFWDEGSNLTQISLEFCAATNHFGTLSVNSFEASIAAGLTCFVLTEDGLRLTTEDGTPIVWRTLNS